VPSIQDASNNFLLKNSICGNKQALDGGRILCVIYVMVFARSRIYPCILRRVSEEGSVILLAYVVDYIFMGY